MCSGSPQGVIHLITESSRTVIIAKKKVIIVLLSFLLFEYICKCQSVLVNVLVQFANIGPHGYTVCSIY